MSKYSYDEDLTEATSPVEASSTNIENLAQRITTEPTPREDSESADSKGAKDSSSIFQSFVSTVGIGGAIVLCLILIKELGLGYPLGELCEKLHWDSAARALKTTGSWFRRKQKNGVLLRGQLPSIKIRDFTWLFDMIALNPYLMVDGRKVCKVTDWDLVDRNFRIRLDDLPEKRLYLYDYAVVEGELNFVFCDEEGDDFYDISLPDQTGLALEELAGK